MVAATLKHQSPRRARTLPSLNLLLTLLSRCVYSAEGHYGAKHALGTHGQHVGLFRRHIFLCHPCSAGGR